MSVFEAKVQSSVEVNSSPAVRPLTSSTFKLSSPFATFDLNVVRPGLVPSAVSAMIIPEPPMVTESSLNGSSAVSVAGELDVLLNLSDPFAFKVLVGVAVVDVKGVAARLRFHPT